MGSCPRRRRRFRRGLLAPGRCSGLSYTVPLEERGHLLVADKLATLCRFEASSHRDAFIITELVNARLSSLDCANDVKQLILRFFGQRRDALNQNFEPLVHASILSVWTAFADRK